jgi:hypothetical protein
VCLERIADCEPSFVAHINGMYKMQVNEAFVFSSGIAWTTWLPASTSL